MTQIEDLEKRVAVLEHMAQTTTEVLSIMKQMIDTLAGFKDKVHPL